MSREENNLDSRTSSQKQTLSNKINFFQFQSVKILFSDLFFQSLREKSVASPITQDLENGLTSWHMLILNIHTRMRQPVQILNFTENCFFIFKPMRFKHVSLSLTDLRKNADSCIKIIKNLILRRKMRFNQFRHDHWESDVVPWKLQSETIQIFLLKNVIVDNRRYEIGMTDSSTYAGRRLPHLMFELVKIFFI